MSPNNIKIKKIKKKAQKITILCQTTINEYNIPPKVIQKQKIKLKRMVIYNLFNSFHKNN